MTFQNPNFSNAERVAEALTAWRNVWQKTPVGYWNVRTLWQTMSDEAEAYELLTESAERAFCRGALEELAFEAKKRLANTEDATLRESLNQLAEAAEARAGAPALEELRCLWELDDAEPSRGGFTSVVGPLPRSKAQSLQIGDVVTLLDDYSVQKIAGTGGQKAVYMVVSKRLGQRFAVKELNPRLGGSQSQRQALEREAKLQAKLQHQGIPKVFILRSDADPASQTLPQFVEVYIEGKTWLDHPLVGESFEKNLDILTQVAKIMAYAHNEGVVHRDLKPENIMIGGYGETYVVDWGLAFDRNKEGAQSGAYGTYSYMAPEQASNKPVDYSADVFSLGAILYKILTGFAPYESALSQGNGRVLKKAQNYDFPPLEPETAKEELLKLAETALASPDASDEQRALAEKAIYAVASPLQIWTFVKKKLLAVDAANFFDENDEFPQPFDGVAQFPSAPFINVFTNDESRRHAVANAASLLDKIARARPRDAVETLRRRAAQTLLSDASDDASRRLAETALVASTSITPKLREILQKALAREPSERFRNAKEFAAALEAYRPQHESLERLAKLMARFNAIKAILDARAFDGLPEVCAPHFERGVQISTEFAQLRRTTQNPLALQAVYREELEARRSLIDKGIELRHSNATKRLIDLQLKTLERYSYDAGDDQIGAAFLTATNNQAARLAIYDKENETPVKTFVVLTLCSVLAFFYPLHLFVALLCASLFLAFIGLGGADLIALYLDWRQNRVSSAPNEKNKRSE